MADFASQPDVSEAVSSRASLLSSMNSSLSTLARDAGSSQVDLTQQLWSLVLKNTKVPTLAEIRRSKTRSKTDRSPDPSAQENPPITTQERASSVSWEDWPSDVTAEADDFSENEVIDFPWALEDDSWLPVRNVVEYPDIDVEFDSSESSLGDWKDWPNQNDDDETPLTSQELTNSQVSQCGFRIFQRSGFDAFLTTYSDSEVHDEQQELAEGDDDTSEWPSSADEILHGEPREPRVAMLPSSPWSDF